MLDYALIGQRVRYFRRLRGLSQEDVAAQIGISLTHFSHIETGKTKLSLQVLVDLAGALSVTADALLSEAAPSGSGSSAAELTALLSGCSGPEADMICRVAACVKQVLDERRCPGSPF